MSSPTDLSDFDELTTAEKILRLQELWDRIAANPADVPISDAERALLDERLRAYEAAPDAGASWDEVRRRLRSR